MRQKIVLCLFVLTAVPLASRAEETESAAADAAEDVSVQTPAPKDAAPATAPKPSAAANRPAGPLQPWKNNFFDNDFRFKQNPDHPYVMGEELKDLPILGEDRFSYGGEVRFRFMNEDNRLRGGFPRQNNYQLWRWRQYFDYHYSDWFRAYAEFIDAASFNEVLRPLDIDEDRWDITNAFFDLRTLSVADQPFYFRFGRQELLYGVERLVSPLDWANTRRTFEGFKMFSRGETWDLDLWATRPVNRFFRSRNEPDASNTFSGAYAVYRGIQQNVFDLYWLWSREQEDVPTLADGSRHTIGTRWQYERPVKDWCGEVCRVWNVEVEGGYQFGHDNGETVRAGFVTAGAGHSLRHFPWQPSLWFFFDWASGDETPRDGENNTFYQLYPLGHRYFGFFDGIGRQNIIDYNLRLNLKPTDKLALVAWMHFFELEERRDALYNVGGIPFARDPNGNSGADVGEELDLTATYNFNPNADVLIGYSWFWDGDFLNRLGRGEKGQTFYVQTSFRY